MRPSPLQDLRLLWTGLARLLERPGLFAAVATAGTLFTGLGPLLRLLGGFPPDPVRDQALQALALLPMGLYVLPRMQAELDARTAGKAENPEGAWLETFEGRWGRYTLSCFLFSLLLVLGFFACLVPMFVVLAAFGFGPMRTLLRGEGILEGFRACARMMARTWPRAGWVAGSLTLLVLLLLLPFGALPPDPPDALPTLKSPWFWLRSGTSALLSAWMSSTFVALFQALEADQPAPSPEAGPDSGSK